MLVVNLFGGPGTGKSTLLHGLMWHAKRAGANCECVLEHAKTLAYRGVPQPWDQEAIMDEQISRLSDLQGSVDIVFSEWPLMMGLAYAPEEEFPDLAAKARNAWDSHSNISFYLPRRFTWRFEGRWQADENAGVIVDEMIKTILFQEGILHESVEPDEAIGVVMERLGL